MGTNNSDEVSINQKKNVTTQDTLMDLVRNLFPDNIIQVNLIRHEVVLLANYSEIVNLTSHDKKYLKSNFNLYYLKLLSDSIVPFRMMIANKHSNIQHESVKKRQIISVKKLLRTWGRCEEVISYQELIKTNVKK